MEDNKKEFQRRVALAFDFIGGAAKNYGASVRAPKHDAAMNNLKMAKNDLMNARTHLNEAVLALELMLVHTNVDSGE